MSNSTERLIEDDPKAKLSSLYNKYISLGQQIQKLKDFSNQMLKASKHEFDCFGPELTYSKTKIESDIDLIESLISQLQSSQIDNDKDLKTKLRKTLKTITEWLPEKKKELASILTELKEYEKRFASEKSHSMENSIDKSSKSVNTLENHNLSFIEYNDNEFVKERGKVLHVMKSVSMKTLDLAKNIRSEVEKQGMEIDNAEEEIRIGKENILKGGEEIKKIAEVGRRQKVRLYFLVFSMIALVGMIALLLRNLII